MRLTEHEMTAALTGAAKIALTDALDASGVAHPGIDVTWDGMGAYQRYQVLTDMGEVILPILIALPDVEVAPGAKPTWALDVVAQVVEDVTASEVESGRRDLAAEHRTHFTGARLAAVSNALAALPNRIDPDGILDPESITITVPDTLEGLS